MRLFLPSLAAALLCVTVASGGSTELRQARLIAEYVHTMEAMSWVTASIVRTLRKYPYEATLCTYVAEIAKMNLKLVKSLRAPKGAESLHSTALRLAEDLTNAIRLHKDGKLSQARSKVDDINRGLLNAVRDLKRLMDRGLLVPAPRE